MKLFYSFNESYSVTVLWYSLNKINCGHNLLNSCFTTPGVGRYVYKKRFRDIIFSKCFLIKGLPLPEHLSFFIRHCKVCLSDSQSRYTLAVQAYPTYTFSPAYPSTFYFCHEMSPDWHFLKKKKEESSQKCKYNIVSLKSN